MCKPDNSKITKTILRKFICAVLFFMPFCGFAQTPSFDTTELTRDDITKIKNFNGSTAHVFGLHVGMTIHDARYAAANFEEHPVVFEQDKYNNNRFYLYEPGDRKKRKTLAYLLWPDKDSGLKEIILFQDAESYIPGGNMLFSKEVLDSTSGIFSSFFGKPASSKIELNIESIHMKNTRYFYPNHSLILVECEKGDEKKYQLVLYNPKG